VATATASLLRTAADITGPVAHDALNQYLVQRVIAFMRMNLFHPELSADIIARDHGVSRRYLVKV
jgi:AraC-like DNA-binding protein